MIFVLFLRIYGLLLRLFGIEYRFLLLQSVGGEEFDFFETKSKQIDTHIYVENHNYNDVKWPH